MEGGRERETDRESERETEKDKDRQTEWTVVLLRPAGRDGPIRPLGTMRTTRAVTWALLHAPAQALPAIPNALIASAGPTAGQAVRAAAEKQTDTVMQTLAREAWSSLRVT
jgi:hypothetical protein